jgi:hypothetical protein
MLGVPVCEHAGILCTGETCKNAVNQAKGAALEHPSSLTPTVEGNTRCAVDFQ